MSVVLGTIYICTLLVSYFIHKWFRIYQLRQKLNWLPSIPGWPLIGNALEFGNSSTIIKDIARLIPREGKTVVLTAGDETSIITTNYDFIEFVLSSHSLLTKSDEYAIFKRWLGNGLVLSNGKKWKTRRRIVTPAFHFSILERFVDVFEANGKILIEKLHDVAGQGSIDIYPFMTRYTLDIICESAMGVQMNAQLDEHNEYGKNVSQLLDIISNRTMSVLKRNELFYKLTQDYKAERKLLNKIHAISGRVIDERKSKIDDKVENTEDSLGRKKRMAFLDILLKSTEDGKPLTREAIKDEVETFMFAGHDTTSTAMSFCIYTLAPHPEVQERILEEQKEIFGNDIFRCCTMKDLQEMKYLECVIKESMRLYPTVPMMGRQLTEDVHYNGKIIPKGVDITIFAYGISTDPDYHPNPEKFDPSRFHNMKNNRPYQYIPFSAGPRNCIGQKYAMLEMKSTLSTLIRNFEISPAVPRHDLMLACQAILKSKNGIRVKLDKRKW